MVGSRWEPGRVGAFIDGFEARLLERGYTPGTVEQVLKYARQFGRWMTAADVEVWQLDESAVDAFLDSRAARTTRQVGTRNLGHLLDYLRSEGVVKPKEVPQPTPVEELVARHRSWLVDERGLASQTILRYERTARRFLQQREDAVGSRFIEDLAGKDVVSFLLQETARVSDGTPHVGASESVRSPSASGLTNIRHRSSWLAVAVSEQVRCGFRR